MKKLISISFVMEFSSTVLHLTEFSIERRDHQLRLILLQIGGIFFHFYSNLLNIFYYNRLLYIWLFRLPILLPIVKLYFLSFLWLPLRFCYSFFANTLIHWILIIFLLQILQLPNAIVLQNIYYCIWMRINPK